MRTESTQNLEVDQEGSDENTSFWDTCLGVTMNKQLVINLGCKTNRCDTDVNLDVCSAGE